MKLHGPTARLVAAAGVSSLITVVLISLVIHARLTDFQEYLTLSLATTEREFVSLAERTDRTEATESSREIVQDCAERIEFDTLLSDLNTLSATQRTRLDYLFGTCADYFYRVKQHHIAELAELLRGYDILRTSHDFIFAGDPARAERATHMTTIVREEQIRATAMRDQIILQREVIDALERGGDDALSIADRINEIGAVLAAADQASDNARAELLK